jgi:hypothetical protein
MAITGLTTTILSRLSMVKRSLGRKTEAERQRLLENIKFVRGGEARLGGLDWRFHLDLSLSARLEAS